MEWANENSHEGKISNTERHATVFVSAPEKPPPTVEDMKVQLLQSEGGSEEDDGDGGDLEDPQDKLKQSCGGTPKCAEMFEVLGECNERVNSKEKTNETCEQELYDFVECVHTCVSKDLFKFLK